MNCKKRVFIYTMTSICERKLYASILKQTNVRESVMQGFMIQSISVQEFSSMSFDVTLEWMSVSAHRFFLTFFFSVLN